MAAEKILLIDASKQDLLPLIHSLLRPAGYAVTRAPNERIGLELALREEPDLIIADQMVMGQDELAMRAKLRQAGLDTPIILTGFSGSAEVYAGALRAGAVDYMQKPIDLREAQRAIMRALGPVTDIRQTSRRLSKRVQELNMLHGLGRAVTSVNDLGALLNRIVEAAVFMTKAEEGFLLLVDQESNELYLRAGKGLGDKLATGFRIKSTDNAAWKVVESGRPVLITGTSEEQQLKIKTGFLVQVLIHVPLKLRGQVIGVLSVDNRVKRQGFTENDMHLLGALADYAAVAIDNAQRIESAQADRDKLSELLSSERVSPPDLDEPLAERVQAFSRLHDLGRAVTSVRDLEKLLARIVEATVDLTQAEEGFILLMDQETDELYMRAGKGLGKTLAAGFRVKSRDSLVWKVIDSGEPFMVGSEVDATGHKIKTGYLVQSMLHVPLKVGDEVTGVLSVNNRTVDRNFTENDQELLCVLADYAAIAIDSVQQYQRAEGEIARLTGLLDTGPLPSDAVQSDVETVRVEWLMMELQGSKEAARSARAEAERLTHEMADQLEAVRGLAERWRRHQSRVEELARRLSVSRVVGVHGGADALAVTVADLQGTLDNLGAGFVITDDLGVVVMANEVATRILHVDGLVGRPLREISLSSNWVSCVDRVHSGTHIGTAVWEQVNFWNRGRLIKALFLPQPAEGATRQIVIFRDLFRERAIQLTLEDMTAAVSQDLRTPLTILSTYTDLLLSEAAGLLVHPQHQLLESMRENLALMTDRLEGAIAMPKAAGEDDESLMSVELDAALQEALVSASPWLEEGKIRLRQELEQDIPRVAAQLDCVYQMIVNLLQNAVKATPAGGEVVLGVEVGHAGNGHSARGHVIVSVRDQGGGVPPELMSQIYERIYSKDSLPVPGIGGTGAELPIVKTLVEAFGGRVWAETEPGVGSKFSFLLPAVAD